ncbi:MAG: carboxypeptidase-like regulatory domain-containing protein [Anaerolineae bacterium]|nr:carboxypeptidase-like regulatory domain-containing protein [Thermoflexales bacterium]MDW8406238.1 carboxypeptidase-like regulatory domain-containing protein [Anaerolineae bacterium]
MKKIFQSWMGLLSLTIAVLVLTVGTAYSQQVAKFATRTTPASAMQAPVEQGSRCTKMEASEVVWVVLDEDGEVVEEEVESYPTETTRITAQFEYNCIPRRTTLVTVWSIDGETVVTAEDKPKASNKPDLWQASLFMQDGSPLPDAEYGVQFYIGKELLTEGVVIVGGEGGVSRTVTVQGTIVDSRTQKPIRGAIVIVLNEGVVLDDWLNEGADEDIYAFAKTDSKGQFVLDNPIPIGVPHSWVIGAQGYRPVIEEDWALEEDTEDPLVLNIKLVKR